LLSGIAKFGGEERSVRRRWAVRICWVVGWPEGGFGADIEEMEAEEGEAGDEDCEESV
jgi:hypothetical protein